MPSAGRLYRRGETWWGRIRLAGREHARSLRTSDRAEARRRLKSWHDELTRVHVAGLTRLSWEDAVLRYTDSVMKDSVSAGTAARYQVSFRQVDEHLAGLYVDQITRPILSDMVRSRKHHGASNATINRDLTAISQVIGATIEWGAAEHNPARDFNRKLLTKERREPIVAPTPEAVDAVVARAPGRFADLIRFLDLVGCRQEEAASLEWRQVDLHAGTCHFPKTKTGRPRTIHLSGGAVALLTAIPRQIKGGFVFWHGAKGERYANVASRFRQIAKDAGQTFRCHDLRHGYAIRELREGRDIYDLSRHLGHSSVKTTEIYLGHVAGGSASKRSGVQSGVQRAVSDNGSASTKNS